MPCSLPDSKNEELQPVFNLMGEVFRCSQSGSLLQGRVGWSMMFGEEMQKRESPDFRFPEVGSSVIGN